MTRVDLKMAPLSQMNDLHSPPLRLPPSDLSADTSLEKSLHSLFELFRKWVWGLEVFVFM